MAKHASDQRRSATSQPDTLYVQNLLSQGFMALSFGDSRKAMGAFKKVSDVRSDSMGVEGLIGGAMAFQQAGEDERAVLLITSALALISGDLDELRALGGTYLCLKKPRYATVLLSAALDMSPCDTSVMYHLANALLASNDCEEGLQIARRAAEISPQSGLANTVLGRALMLNEKWEEAIEATERAMELLEDKRVALLQLAFCLTRCERWEEAYNRYREAAAAGAPEALVDFGLVQTLPKMGRIDEAKAIGKRLLKIAEHGPEAAHLLADLQAEAGPVVEADRHAQNTQDASRANPLSPE
jgi:tetratricopeptide (TPR) repeat protein